MEIFIKEHLWIIFVIFKENRSIAAIIMLGISIALFRGNSSSELDLIFIYFS